MSTKQTLRERLEGMGFFLKDFDGDYDEMIHAVLSKLEATEMAYEDYRARMKRARESLEGDFE